MGQEQEVLHDVAFRLHEAEVAKEPGSFYEEVRQCPVAHSSDHGGFWMIGRYEDVHAATRNPKAFSSADGVLIPRLPIPPQVCLEQDDPDHAHFRHPIQAWLSPGRVAELEPRIREVVRSLIQDFASGEHADVALALGEPVPAIIAAMLLGMPQDHWPIFRDQMARCLGNTANEKPEEAAIAAGEMMTMLGEALEDRRSNPRDDLVTVISELVIDGKPISSDEAISMLFLILGAGHETTAGAIAGLLYYVARDLDAQKELRADPTKITEAVEEALRLVSPLPGMARHMKESADVGGTTLNEGEWVMLMFGSANRDPAVFEDPEAFRLGRANNRHMAFGGGVHRCVGAPLARLEMRIVLEEMFDAFSEFTLDDEGAVSARYGTSRGYLRVPVRWR